ncbi:P-loop containing nucleoside triphosphate hydrolase protein [Amanita muscaria]
MTISPAIVLRRYSTHRSPLIHFPLSSIYNLGDAPPSSRNTGSKPIIQDLQWTVHDDEAWAVISSGSGKEALFKALLGRLRISPHPPPPGGLFPLLSLPPNSEHTRDPYTSISLVSFRHHSGGQGGAFYDFTARYGAMRDEEQRVTLLESMFPRFLEMRREREPKFAWQREEGSASQTATRNSEPDESMLTEHEQRLFKDLVERTGLRHMLDVPVVTLSNGQMRRARIVKAVLKRPELMLLDEPLTGLDKESRPRLLDLLRELHSAKQPRVIMGLRAQDEIPSWVTHVAFVNKGRVQVGRKDDMLQNIEAHILESVTPLSKMATGSEKKGRTVVDIKNANIAYDNRKVLSNISWTIRLGDRWHLQGANGSGKSTLLSLITGAHPLSFSLPRLSLYNQKRARIPTPLIQSRIGEMSPELFDAFPRRMPGMTVWAVLGTGFEGTFIERGRESVGVGIGDGGLGVGIREQGTNELCWDGIKGDKWEEVKEWRIKRCWEVLQQLGPDTWEHNTPPGRSGDVSPMTREFAKRWFTELSRGEQRIVLVMRALVGRPPLVLLDEALSGMSDGMVRAVKRYLSEGGLSDDQALVAISHWEDELPLHGRFQVIKLEKGEAFST